MIMDDPFIKMYIDDVLRNIRTQVLLKLVTPYRCIDLAFLAQNLNVTVVEVEELLVMLVLDQKLRGLIDQTTGILTLHSGDDSAVRKYDALEKWVESLSSLQTTLVSI
jgi:COP9 signalosome complex subunit 2